MPDLDVLLEVFGYTLMALGTVVLLGAALVSTGHRPRRDPVDAHADDALAIAGPTMQLPVGVPGSYDGPAAALGKRVKGMRLQGHTTVVLTRDADGVATWWVGRAPVAPRHRRDGGR